jgi:molybdopterin-guanine dinucleotide biosynthesis protein B
MKVFGFAGPSGSGKTTVIENVIPLFSAMGLSVSVIKHTHHDFDVDRPGKDSWRQRQAGAREVLLTSDTRWVLMHELGGAPEAELPEQLAHLSPCDLVLVEGFKRQPIPKLEVWRLANNSPRLYLTDPNIVAIATDAKLDIALPTFALGDYPGLAQFILQSAKPADGLFFTSSGTA